MDRYWLIISTGCFLLGFGYTVFAIRSGRFLPTRFNFIAVATGFAFQTLFLWVRGEELGRCPLTNLFEVFVFVSWAMTLIYMIVGTAYRLSLMGAFTSPVAFFIQTAALALPVDRPAAVREPSNPWLEVHAAMSIISYGAFLLAGVAGVMWLLQDRQLKKKQIGSLFYRLPPINHLSVANRRLVLVGWLLLTVGLAAGFMVGRPTDAVKFGLSAMVWVFYGIILIGRAWKSLAPRWMAMASVVAGGVVLATLWGVSVLSHGGGR